MPGNSCFSKKKSTKNPHISSVSALGIFDAKTSKSLVVSSYDDGEISKENIKFTFTEVNTPINLVSNAPATYTVGDDGQNYTLKFDLDSTIGYKAGKYNIPINIIATQE